MSDITEIQFISSKFDHSLLDAIVKKTFGLNNINVVDVNINSNSKKGDSYLSTVCRITVKAKDENTSDNKFLYIITKGLPRNLARRKTFRSVDFFANEVTFYNKVWPALHEFQISKNVVTFNNIPVCYYAFADGINDIIALDDVSYKGFQGISRSTGLDINHTAIILKLFANFHGTSLAFKMQLPDKFEEITNDLHETYFTEKFRPWYQNFQKINLQIVRDAIEKELPDIYLTKFDKIVSGDFFGNISKLCGKRGKFAVFTHGDAWVPNFLMKYDSNNVPLEGIMIDFQLLRACSLAQDILFFLYACTTQELRDKHWDSLINDYYIELKDTLQKLGSDSNAITLENLHNELKDNALFGVGMAIEAVTMSILDDDETADIDELQGDDAHPLEKVWIIHPFKSKEKRQRICSPFKDAIDRGYLP